MCSEVPCMDTKPRSNVEPNIELPLNVIVIGKVILLICAAPFEVV